MQLIHNSSNSSLALTASQNSGCKFDQRLTCQEIVGLHLHELCGFGKELSSTEFIRSYTKGAGEGDRVAGTLSSGMT